MKTRIKVILVDDHAVVRAGFRMLLSTDDTIEVIAEADRGEAACQLYLEKQPDVMVLDLSMPGIGGLETIRRICNRDSNVRSYISEKKPGRNFVWANDKQETKSHLKNGNFPAIIRKVTQYLLPGFMNNRPF